MKNIDTLLKQTLSNAKAYETESDFLDDVENGYIAQHVNEKNVMRDAEEFKEEFIINLTAIEDLEDFKAELLNLYGHDVDNLDKDGYDDLVDTLKYITIIYIDETETYYID